MRKHSPRKLVLNLETLRRLDETALQEAAGRELLAADTGTCASNKRCTGCADCFPTGQ